MNRVPMTPEGHAQLQQERQQLIAEARPRVIKAIEEARAHGDLSENAEYDAAKQEQGLIEAKIAHLESRLSDAQIIDVSTMENTGRVIFGATVTLVDCNSGEEKTYRIVGEDQADIDLGLLSVASPVARALVGKHLDDQIEVETPRGTQTYDITDVQYLSAS